MERNINYISVEETAPENNNIKVKSGVEAGEETTPAEIKITVED